MIKVTISEWEGGVETVIQKVDMHQVPAVGQRVSLHPIAGPSAPEKFFFEVVSVEHQVGTLLPDHSAVVYVREVMPMLTLPRKIYPVMLWFNGVSADTNMLYGYVDDDASFLLLREVAAEYESRVGLQDPIPFSRAQETIESHEGRVVLGYWTPLQVSARCLPITHFYSSMDAGTREALLNSVRPAWLDVGEILKNADERTLPQINE